MGQPLNVIADGGRQLVRRRGMVEIAAMHGQHIGETSFDAGLIDAFGAPPPSHFER